MSPRSTRHLAGQPFALPPWLDAVAERWWRTRPRTRTAITLVLLTLVVLTVVSLTTPSAHGPPTGVWLADDDLAIGTTLDPATLRRASWPRDLVPDGALDDPVGSLVAPLPRGAVATDRHVGDGGLAATLLPGTAAVALPPESLPELAPGTRVDLIATGTDGSGMALASDAVVLSSDALAIWIAVERAAAVEVTAAGLHGSIGVVVLPP